MVDHLEDRAVGALRVELEDPEDDEAELRDRRVAEHQSRVVWENASTEPYRIDTTAIDSIISWKCTVAAGKSGSTMRRKPYTPTFESTAENSTSTGIGAAL